MPRPKPERQVLDIPLTSGLSQKEDPAWVAPGQAIQMTNFVKGKLSTIEKVPGYKGANVITPAAGPNVATVQRVASHQGVPLVVATDASYGPALYSYFDSQGTLSIIDRISEVIVPPPTVATSAVQGILEMDCAVIATAGVPSLVVHIFLTPDPSTSTNRVYYAVTDYASGTTVVAAQEVPTLTYVSSGFNTTLYQPKLNARCTTAGNTLSIVLTVTTFAGLYGLTLNTTTLIWGAATLLSSDPFTSMAYPGGVYDSAIVDDDVNVLVAAFESTNNANTLRVSSYNAISLSQLNTGIYSKSASPHLTGVTVRCSGSSGAVWFAYGGHNGSGTTINAFVKGGALTYPSLVGAACTETPLLPAGFTHMPGPQLLDIKEVNASTQQVVWSPPNTKIGYDPAYVANPTNVHISATPQAAIFQAMFSSGAAPSVIANSFRWTNGVTLASRMYPYQFAKAYGAGNSQIDATSAYIVGFVPSQNLNPTASGVNTVSPPNTANVTGVPYSPYVTFVNGRGYGVSASYASPGGAQAAPTVSPGQQNLNPFYLALGNVVYLSSTGGNVSSINITQPGSGYTSAPTAVLNWGCGATFTVNFAQANGPTQVSSITISNAKYFYADAASIATTANPNIANVNVQIVNGTSTLPVGQGLDPAGRPMPGMCLQITNASNANNNGTFAILNINSPNVVGWSTISIFNPRAHNGDTANAALVTNSGGGFGYNQQPNTVPVWFWDLQDGSVAFSKTNVYFAGWATVATPNNSYAATPGTIVGVSLDPGFAKATIANVGAGTIAHGYAFVPEPSVSVAYQFMNTGGTPTTAVGINANVNTANLASTVGYNAPTPATTLVGSTLYQNVQGTFVLFAMDTFGDATSPNDNGTNFQNTPLRAVAVLKPRLALNNMFTSALTLPRWAQTYPNGFPPGTPPSAPVFDLPVNLSPTIIGVHSFQPLLFPLSQFGQGAYGFAELGGLTAFAGGLPTLTDGARVSEFAFPYFPENTYVFDPSGPNTGGTLLNGTSYQYIATYERVDNSGNVHRSARSVPVTFVTLPTYDTSGYQLEVVIPTMGFSTSQHGSNLRNLANVAPQRPVAIRLYRTSSTGSTTGGPATNGSAGTVFYSVTANNAPVGYNELWSPYITYVDGTSAASSDSSISVYPQLYGDGSNGASSGGVLDNLCPPPLQALITHKNRFWGFEGNNVWYTKAFTSGEGPGFNELLAFSVDDGSSNITALASLDERLIIFKRDRIFYVAGDGPTDAGQSNDLQPPQKLQVDVGALSQAAVVSTPTGIFFLSDNGLYELSRKLEVTNRGAFVADTLAQFPIITSGTLDMQNARIVWTASAPYNGSLFPGYATMTYSFLFDAWTIERLDNNGLGDFANTQVASAALTGTTPTLTLAGNYIDTQNPFLFRERSDGVYYAPKSAGGNAYQTSTWQSPWIKGAGIEGFARFEKVTLAWYNPTAHKLSVNLDYNYSNQYTQSFSVTATAMSNAQVNGTPYPIVQWEFQPNHPKAESMQITVSDSADAQKPTNTAKGPILVGCTVTVRTKEGTFRVPVAQRGSA